MQRADRGRFEFSLEIRGIEIEFRPISTICTTFRIFEYACLLIGVAQSSNVYMLQDLLLSFYLLEADIKNACVLHHISIRVIHEAECSITVSLTLLLGSLSPLHSISFSVFLLISVHLWNKINFNAKK